MSRLIIAEPNKNSVKSNIQRMSTPASPKYYSKSVQEPWFSLIKTGIKTIEGRLCKGDFALMRAGDYVTWTRAETEDRPTKTRAETEDHPTKTRAETEDRPTKTTTGNQCVKTQIKAIPLTLNYKPTLRWA